MDVVDEIKSQYARLLVKSDWHQFKEIAEYYFEVSAHLKNKDIGAKRNKLLLRNMQKRLYLGIGCELLIKAFYLKDGYCINKFKREYSGKRVPTHKLLSLKKADIDHKKTFTLDALINHLNNICSLECYADIKRGLKIAMVFRNKEGHVAFPSHEFNEQNYRDIENAVKRIFKEAFGEELHFRISMKPREKGVFKVFA